MFLCSQSTDGEYADDLFRVYVDHRYSFAITVDDERTHNIAIGLFDDPWAIAAVVCPVFVAADLSEGDSEAGSCERRVSRSLEHLYGCCCGGGSVGRPNLRVPCAA